MNDIHPIIIIGGGAAGMFAAIKAAENLPQGSVLLLEQSQQLLSKVKISGGGRCNVTHACFDPKKLIQNYPRGSKELLGPFNRFQPQDTLQWFEKRGVTIKKEEDGRMFPLTNLSQTIIDCLLNECVKQGVRIQLGAKVIDIEKNECFEITLKSKEKLYANTVMLAMGGNPLSLQLIKKLGHTIIDQVPSLFTFNLPNSPLLTLSGISLKDVKITLPKFKLESRGPFLLTHWGFSGPAILKLSAWAARELNACGYQTELLIDWLPHLSAEEIFTIFEKNHKELISAPLLLPKKLWYTFLDYVNLAFSKRWGDIKKADKWKLIEKLKNDLFLINGKTTYKQEFVTAGGVKLTEVDFKTMESKLIPHLFFGGEILDIDGITGGFNFQAAWTTGWIAGDAMNKLSS